MLYGTFAGENATSLRMRFLQTQRDRAGFLILALGVANEVYEAGLKQRMVIIEFPSLQAAVEAHESPETCLVREIHEELGARVRVGDRILVTRHAYPERSVELHFFGAELLDPPVPQIGQEMRWVPRADLASLELPDADADLIRLLTS